MSRVVKAALAMVIVGAVLSLFYTIFSRPGKKIVYDDECYSV